MTWEEIDSEDDTYTDRLDVPGGWLYRTRVYTGEEEGDRNIVSIAMAFVPVEGSI